MIRLDDGKANALSPAVLAAIDTALDQAEEAGNAVLIVGRPGRFSAGFDLGVMREGGPVVAKGMVKNGAQLALRPPRTRRWASRGWCAAWTRRTASKWR